MFPVLPQNLLVCQGAPWHVGQSHQRQREARGAQSNGSLVPCVAAILWQGCHDWTILVKASFTPYVSGPVSTLMWLWQGVDICALSCPQAGAQGCPCYRRSVWCRSVSDMQWSKDHSNWIWVFECFHWGVSPLKMSYYMLVTVTQSRNIENPWKSINPSDCNHTLFEDTLSYRQ